MLRKVLPCHDGFIAVPLWIGNQYGSHPFMYFACVLTLLEHGHYENLFIEVLVTVVQLISILNWKFW